MKQAIEITGYHVPWHATENKRAVFSDKSTRNAFLKQYETGYVKLYNGLDFHPRQETLVLSPAAYTAAEMGKITQINYVRARVYTSLSSAGAYNDYFYFVTDNPIPPIYEGDADGNSISITAKIKMDVWTTYVYPANPTFINTGTIIEQSTPLTPSVRGVYDPDDVDGIEPLLSAKMPFGNTPQSFDGRNPVNRFAGLGTSGISNNKFGARDETTTLWNEATAFRFVGIFGSEYSGTLVLTRPIDLYSFGEEGYAGIETLLHVNKLAPCRVARNGYVDDESGAITGDAFNVNLLRAYIIPARAMQGDTTETGSFGYRIKATSDLGDYPRKTAFAQVLVGDVADFSVDISFLTPDIISGTVAGNGFPVYVDIGTPTTRLQIPPPTMSTNAEVKFWGQATLAGYSLIMQVDGRQVDLGGDFEIPVPDNAEAEAFARNKWSIALQGVSQVGGLAAAVISKNPVAIVGAAVSAGQYLANIGEQQSVPSTIQGQGNGLLTYGVAKQNSRGGTLGAVYCRYAFTTNYERKQASRWGYKWLDAWVEDTKKASTAFFLNGATGKSGTFSYIKTGACSISFSATSYTTEGGGEGINSLAVPDFAVEELQRLFDEGVFIYYNPTAGAGANLSGGFGA